MLKLNLGSGPNLLPHFENLDRKTGQEVFPLKYETGSVDEIRASHILEHFSEKGIWIVLNEWARVLKPGGLIRIAVPDLKKIIEDPEEKWAQHIMGGQTDHSDYHRSVFTREKLTSLLLENGFDSVTEGWVSEIDDCARLPVSLNLSAKRTSQPARKVARKEDAALDVKICAVMSLPRLGWNEAWGCIADALAPFKIPVHRYTGAFWDQCIQRSLEFCIKENVDWALTLDYDTCFTRFHLDRMLGIFASNPNIDALAACQPKRRTGTPLMTVEQNGKMQTDVVLDGSPIQCHTAHFGFTLIRLDRLRDLPKPWFVSVPGKNGSWTDGEGKIDADIYFWEHWRKHGRTLFVDPGSRVGHLELEVSNFDEKYQRRFSVFEDWKKEMGLT